MKERIKELRKNYLKLTQTEFAQKLNIAQTTCAGYEAGRRELTDRVIADICRVFDVNENWLRTGEPPIFKEETEIDRMKKQIDKIMEGRNEFAKYSLYTLASFNEQEWEIVEKKIYEIQELTRKKNNSVKK